MLRRRQYLTIAPYKPVFFCGGRAGTWHRLSAISALDGTGPDLLMTDVSMTDRLMTGRLMTDRHCIDVTIWPINPYG